MNKKIALGFAVLNTLFLIGVAGAISFRKPWLILLFTALTVINTGLGFVVKSRQNRRFKG